MSALADPLPFPLLGFALSFPFDLPFPFEL
jgi:hypothetical protein